MLIEFFFLLALPVEVGSGRIGNEVNDSPGRLRDRGIFPENLDRVKLT